MNRLIVVSNSYPSNEDPSNMVFIHNRTKQLGTFYKDVVVISRKKIKYYDLLRYPKVKLNQLIEKVNFTYFDGITIIEMYCLHFFPEHILPINGLFYYSRFKRIVKPYIISGTTVQLATWGDFSFLASICFHRLKVPFFASAIGNYENTYLSKPRSLNYRVLKYIFTNSSFVMCRSEELEGKVKNAFKHTKTINYISGVDLSVFRNTRRKEDLRVRHYISKDELVIIYSGRINRLKGINELVTAFDYLKSELTVYKLRLILIGQKNMSLSSIRLCANISVLPPVAQNSLVEYLNLSDIFVLPSYSEGLSNSLMEAMAVGLPVVATKVGDNTKLVKNGYTGLLIEPKSVEQIIVSLRKLILNADLRNDLGSNALAMMRSIYGNNKLGPELYAKIIETKCYN